MSTFINQLEEDAVPDPAERIKLAIMLHDHLEGLIRGTDNKASIILAANTFLAAAIALTHEGMVFQISNANLPLTVRLLYLVSILIFLALLTSILFALFAAQPVLKVKKESAQDLNILYFGHIIKMGEPTFTQDFLSSPDPDMAQALLLQVYAKSVIANRKFSRLAYSNTFLVIAVVLWLLHNLLTAFVG